MLVATSVALAISIPWLFFLRSSPLSWSTAVSFLLLIHSLAGLHTLLVQRPPNIFTALNIPFNTPTDTIRALLLRHSDSPELGAELEGLLRRLASFDARSLYPRFGHNVLTTCTYCQSFDDFALYALPRLVLSYIREIAFIGLITTRLRKAAVTALVVMGCAEIYTLATVNIKIPLRGSKEPVVMWHDLLLTLRHTIFLLLPLLIHFLPRIPFLAQLSFFRNPATTQNQVDSTNLLIQTHQTLTQHLLPALHLLKYGQAATMRVPALRERAEQWWEEEARVGAWIRGDGVATAGDSDEVQQTSVRCVARGLGASFDEGGEGVEEGKLRTNAKRVVSALVKDGVRVSEHWRQP
ncbi:hypothetical protein Hypma_007215 [Hypsizygus marmoreus]|uniref:Uncharacterized protein n=1 Tax=Hypsizygus marmoreus TaxID=39966 RepID=A0A369K9D9_HYPMA|nr:hypothetical protein Hypma_007215 [Hypsizygus marmoreus]